MEQVNLIETLRNVPIGSELYSRTFGKVTLVKVHSSEIEVLTQSGNIYRVTYDGRLELEIDGEIIITNEPDISIHSSENEYKEGDILVCLDNLNNGMFMYKKQENSSALHYYFGYLENPGIFKGSLYLGETWTDHLNLCRLATKEEKERFFLKLTDHDLFWSETQKTLREIYKPGDFLTIKKTKEIFIFDSYSIDGIRYRVHLGNDLRITTGRTLGIYLDDVYKSTDQEIIQFSSVLARRFNWDGVDYSEISQIQNILSAGRTTGVGLGMPIIPMPLSMAEASSDNQLIINNEPEPELKHEEEIVVKTKKPKRALVIKHLDQVLVRNNSSEPWIKDVFDKDVEDKDVYICLNGEWSECIPYTKETGYLLNTREEFPENLLS